MNKVVDQQLSVLADVYTHKSLREMADRICKSLGTVQTILRDLENLGYVTNPDPGLARSRVVTKEGLHVLRTSGLLPRT